MGRRARSILVLAVALTGFPTVASAGMPTIGLSEIARLRIETISFFLMAFLACAWVVQRLWNGLGRDLERLPRLSYGNAVGVVALWGLLFLLVLTMISGARELMTPGAWEKQGLTYKLRDKAEGPAKPPDDPREGVRTRALERLRDALWRYAQAHEGHFPPKGTTAEMPEEAWLVPDPSGMRYLYVEGLVADEGASPLVYEPGIFGPDRLVLLTSGEIRRMPLDQIKRASAGGRAD